MARLLRSLMLKRRNRTTAGSEYHANAAFLSCALHDRL